MLIKIKNKMNTEIFQTIEPDLLEDSCYKKIKEEVKRILSEDELNEKKTELFDLVQGKLIREEFKKSVSDLMDQDHFDKETFFAIMDSTNFGNSGLKQIKKRIPKLASEIRNGYTIQEETLYCFDYQEINKMALYTSDGQLNYVRPLMADERQMKIRTLNKTGTNE